MSQPLTSLRCSLELSLELPPGNVAEQQQESVAVALQQTEKVIGMVQLIREYLDAEQPPAKAFSSALAPALEKVTDALSSIAATQGIRLLLVGTCAATLPVAEAQLRLALQYLVAAMMETQPAGGELLLSLAEGPGGTVLRLEGKRNSLEHDPGKSEESVMSVPASRFQPTQNLNPAASTETLQRVRLAIAGRVLEGAGASLVFADGVEPAGFTLRIPRQVESPDR